MACGGCATLMRGQTQKVTFETEPAGATVTIGGKDYTTPATVELKRKETYAVTVAKAGFRSVVFRLQAQWDGASLGNAVLPGGSVGFATDTTLGTDRAFRGFGKIKLPPATAATTQPLALIHYRGKLLTQEEYDAALAAEAEEESKMRR